MLDLTSGHWPHRPTLADGRTRWPESPFYGVVMTYISHIMVYDDLRQSYYGVVMIYMSHIMA